MSLHYLLYDVFTGTPLLGNQLAVFTDARGLDTALMQRIAREMNLSESTFILPAEEDGTGIRMRIFTPASELPMAGHPTIGSTFALAHTGVIARGTPRFVFGLNIGPVPVDLEWGDQGSATGVSGVDSAASRERVAPGGGTPARRAGASLVTSAVGAEDGWGKPGDRTRRAVSTPGGTGLRFVWMTQSNPAFGAPVEHRGEVAAALGLSADALVPDLPVQEVSCGLPYLLVPIRTRETVDAAVSDAAAFKRLASVLGSELPIFLFSISGLDTETVYSRMFAPSFGIVEDPATGSASGPLGCYLVRHGLVSGDAARRIVNVQGVAMGRMSRIHISIAGTPAAIDGVKVGGEAVLVGRGELLT